MDRNVLLLITILISTSDSFASGHLNWNRFIECLKGKTTLTENQPRKVIPERTASIHDDAVIRNAPHVEDLEIPNSSLEMLEKSELYSLKSKFNNGKNLVIKTGFSAELFAQFALGEQIQNRLLIQILKRVFPEARFIDSHDPHFKLPPVELRSGERLIQIRIADSGVGAFDKKVPILEMSTLKSSNPTSISLRDIDMKGKLGIPADKKVVSLYLKHPSGSGDNTVPAYDQIIKMFPADKKPDVVFLSKGGAAFDSEVAERLVMSGPIPEGYEFVWLSDFKNYSKHYDGKKLIVLNDVKGVLPSLYRASDLAVITGPINLFEPLDVGTPVIFYDNATAIGMYDSKVFSQMADLAESTGGGIRVKNNRQFVIEAGKVISRNFSSRDSISPPSLTKGPKKTTAWEDLLAKINKILTSQLDDKNPPDVKK